MGGSADVFGDDFLGLRELGVASELRVSTLSVPKELPRAKARMGTGNSLPYVKPLFVSSPRLFTFIRTVETSLWNFRHPSHRHLHSSHSSQRGWKTKLLDFCVPSSSPVSMPSRRLKLLPQNPHSPPRTAPQYLESLRHPNLHRSFQGSCCSHLSPFQHYRNPPPINLHHLNNHQYSPFQTMCQPRPKRRWGLSGRSLVGNRRTLARRNPRRRKTPRSPELAAVAASPVS